MNSLIPVEQKEVIFYDDEITAVRLGDGRVFVPARPLCDALGVDWSAQSRRIGRDAVLSASSMSVAVAATDIDSESKRPRTSHMLCLPIELIETWLGSIKPSRLKPYARQKLSSMQSHIEYKQRNAHVYVLCAKERGSHNTYFKIGRTSQNAQEYIKRTPTTWCPLPIETTILIKCSELSSHIIESELHGLFADKRANGEWFNLSPDDIEFIKREYQHEEARSD